jgi:hypothetical protein
MYFGELKISHVLGVPIGLAEVEPTDTRGLLGYVAGPQSAWIPIIPAPGLMLCLHEFSQVPREVAKRPLQKAQSSHEQKPKKVRSLPTSSNL